MWNMKLRKPLIKTYLGRECALCGTSENLITVDDTANLCPKCATFVVGAVDWWLAQGDQVSRELATSIVVKVRKEELAKKGE